MNNQNISFDDLKKDIKKIIVKNFKKNKETDTLLDVINNISLDIISASFDKEQLFSGNIDARKIKQVAKDYSFSCKTNGRKTRDGIDLLKIKTNRNYLAHGFKSFKDVGKENTAEELLEIKKRVICYLREILQNIEDYISKKEYLK
ncbi:conserved hypothetical protein [Hyella patelloides LEGE 07179]|uniref:MAE-28990/MAE-18760-like HEPN domain-containing protein n=1 Tax=Hyella patelloides LEGE 07179 TaxID=945734 RepID=A0A563VZR5_9CYAN|nr:conserved hypothetical protein [Hyella patelloides LEGE 07179]